MMKDSKKVGVDSKWRTAAIILGIILLIMLGLMAYGMHINNVETECVNYCYEKHYESFSYNAPSGLCSCYMGSKIAEIIPMN